MSSARVHLAVYLRENTGRATKLSESIPHIASLVSVCMGEERTETRCEINKKHDQAKSVHDDVPDSYILCIYYPRLRSDVGHSISTHIPKQNVVRVKRTHEEWGGEKAPQHRR